MAEVSGGGSTRSLSMYVPSNSFKLPEDPSLCRRVETPMASLLGMLIDGRHPNARQHCYEPKLPGKWRSRRQVGVTNRCRLESLGSDLLGQSQAIRSLVVPFNHRMVQLITAENPKSSVNTDMEQPYMCRIGRSYSDVCSRKPTERFHCSQSSYSSLTPARSQTTSSMPPIQPIKSFVPSSARPPKPQEVFQYHVKRNCVWGTLDGLPSQKRKYVTLRCLDTDWHLHQPFIAKSETLSALLDGANVASPRRAYRSAASETIDNFISRTPAYSQDYQERASRLSMREDSTDAQTDTQPADPNSIELKLSDPMITKHALAVALGNLYHEDVEVDVKDVAGVAAAAFVLRFRQLQQGCAQIMLSSIKSNTVCKYHQVASKYHCDEVAEACERWLELNLVHALGQQVHLRDLSLDCLLKVLRSPRLFTFSEFALFRVVACWLFMQLNPSMQLVPTYNTIVTFFNSLPKTSSLIEREEGQHYASVFAELRLHGITETWQLQNIQSMNILPQAWVVKIFSQHYHALQSGGDMSLLNKFDSGAVRTGFVIDEEPHYHSELVSLFGFHFELKAVRDPMTKTHSFFMQRLKPNDPILSFRQCERQTFSMRSDRDVRYSVRVQYVDGDAVTHNLYSGVLCQRFGLAEKTSRSDMITFDDLVPPLYVTFSILFPPS